MIDDIKVKVIIPIYNPDEKFRQLMDVLRKQTIKSLSVLIIDSGTDKSYKNYIDNFSDLQIYEISAKEFDHGGTRQMGVDKNPNNDIYVFLTQDAILENNKSIEYLIEVFNDKSIGCAYGRQLPHDNAGIFAIIARKFNYPKNSHIYAFSDRVKYGMKTAFISNSFAAYRKEALESVKGFPNDTILSEDMYVAAKMLLSNWRIAYVADSCVYHSHNYTILQEFKRYFDIGVFHEREKWIRETFGKAEGEGIRFICNEFNIIIRYNIFLIFYIMFRDGMKFLGYRLGLNEKHLSKNIKLKISMNRKYWKNKK